MKSDARILKEIVADRISFKIGDRRFYFTREELGIFIERYLGASWHLGADDYPPHAVAICNALKDYHVIALVNKLCHHRNKKWRDPVLFARFRSLEEAAEFLGVEI